MENWGNVKFSLSKAVLTLSILRIQTDLPVYFLEENFSCFTIFCDNGIRMSAAREAVDRKKVGKGKNIRHFSKLTRFGGRRYIYR